MRRNIAVVTCTLLALSSVELVGPAQATQLLFMSPQDLGREAPLFIRGWVQSVESYWNGKHTEIFTRIKITVDETYKGSAGDIVEIVQLGGTVGKVKVSVQGALQWKPGEEVLLFAEPYDAGTFQVSGFSQGKFIVERNPATGVAYVQAPAMDGVQLLGAPGAGAPTPQAPSRLADRQRLSVAEFVSQALTRPAEPGVER
jgi:hypothetical protein